MKFRNVFIFIYLFFISSCSIFRPLVYNLPDEKDLNKFHYRTIQSSDKKEVFNFFKSTDTLSEIKNLFVEDKSLNATNVTLTEFSKLHNTISLLIIRNDSILYENYSDKYNSSNNVASFSIAKSYVTMLIGIAINDGLIKNIDQPIIDFIPEWKNKVGYDLITIKNLLTHTSGLKFSNSYWNSIKSESEFYYGTNLREDILSCKAVELPGTKFDYQNENTCLLGLILERVTDRTLSEYLEEKIWNKIGTESNALWSIDRNDINSLAIEKAFCCINARTIDFAKFARLLLNKGNWNGTQIIPEKWIDEATKRSNGFGEKLTYGYNIGLGPAEYNSFYPIGLYGQLLYVYPKKNLIIVRFGDKDINYNPSYWKEIMLQMVDQL